MADDEDDFDIEKSLEESLKEMEENANDDVNENENEKKDNNDTVINVGDGNRPQTIAPVPVTNMNDEDGEGGQPETKNDDDTIQDALDLVTNSVNSANNDDMLKDDEMKDFFNEIFTQFSNLDDNANENSLDAALKKVMHQFFDANQLREPVEIICGKYPYWLDENKNDLAEVDYNNYKKQCDLYKEANILLADKKPDTDRILDILLQTFEYGSLPPAVMDGMMPDELKQFADQMAKFDKDNFGAQDGGTTKGNNESNNNNNNNNDDLNADEAMKFFRQLLDQPTPNNKKDKEFMPTLDDLPNLNDEEMKEVKRLMNQDGCLMM